MWCLVFMCLCVFSVVHGSFYVVVVVVVVAMCCVYTVCTCVS